MILLFFVLHLSGQISPGDLSLPHAHLKGLSNCTKCHTLGEKVTNKKCLDCHQEIGIRISEGRGYHSSVEVRGNMCVDCHSDHHGQNFKMIHMDTDHFDHALTDYTLQGAHAKLACIICHKSEFIMEPDIKVKSGSYLGLDQKCLSCHPNQHQGTLSSDCASCHGFNSFKHANKFDHAKTQFPLRGKHSQVDCKLCHKVSLQNGKEIQLFKGISYGKCTDCHRDIHDNKFGQNCTQCHSEISFHQIKGMDSFNHSRTSYPLEGKHRVVACASCHKAGYTKDLKYGRCLDCHSDYHKKQFVTKDKTPDCAKCHSVQGFEQSSFTIEMHNESSFQLTGAHLATPCFTCHKKNDRWSFREIGINCNDCHENIHESVLDPKYDPEPFCVNCHKSGKWSEIAFDHSKTGYILEGAHRRQSCKTCHFKALEQGMFVQRFSQLSSACTECHKDVHENQFGSSNGNSCLKCHDYFDWSAGLFNHNNTAFPLDGKHQNVACAKCHPKVVTAQHTYTRYKLKSFTCESCH
jgi:hypothetical protein